MYEYKARVVRVVDGDTVVLDIDLGLHVSLKQQHCRLLGIDAPERYSDEGKRAKKHLESIIGDEIIIKTDLDKLGSFHRILVTLFKSGVNLNQQMVATGNAKVRHE